jgi:hypothetical protein
VIARTLGDPDQRGLFPIPEGTMNRFRSLVIPALGALVGLFLTSTVAMAQQNTATASATPAGVTIAAAITIVHTAHLHFGQIVAGTGAGTVVQTALASPGRTATGCTLGNTTGMTPATFSVGGEPNATYAITLPGDSDVTLTGPGDPMAITAFSSSPVTTGTLNGSGAQTLYVGGTLNVGAAQVAGAYTGTFDVTVTYN